MKPCGVVSSVETERAVCWCAVEGTSKLTITDKSDIGEGLHSIHAMNHILQVCL